MQSKWVSLYGLLALAAAATAVDAITPAPVFIPNRYIVQFNRHPKSRMAMSAQAMSASLDESGVGYDVNMVYEGAFTGMSVTLEEDTPNVLADLEQVAEVWPVRLLKGPRTYLDGGFEGFWNSTTSASSTLQRRQGGPPAAAALPNLTLKQGGVSRARSELNLTGAGVKIAFIDTGLDYTHPAFGNCYKTAGCRVAYGQDLVGDDYDGVLNPVAVPDDDPQDTCIGHGTHVAGIATGKDGVFEGVAPNATLGIYRVFGCVSNDVGEDIIVQAMLAAQQDGMQVINVSAGEPGSWAQAPSAAVADILFRQYNIITVGANGNLGHESLYSPSSPATGSSALSVTAYNSEQIYYNTMTINAGETKELMRGIDFGAPFPPLVYTDTPVARVPDLEGAYYGCAGYSPGALTGKIVLLDFTMNCDDDDRVDAAASAGALAVILDQGFPGLPTYYFIRRYHPISVAPITPEDAAWLRSKISAATTPVTLTSDSSFHAVNHPTPGSIQADLSSYGPDPELNIKPEVGAPGDKIYSTVPAWRGMYTINSGTSMSTAYVTGAVALMLEAKVSPKDIKALLMQSSTPYCPSKTGCETVARQGAGLLNVYNAITTPIISSVNSFALNDTLNGSFDGDVTNRDTTIKNRGKTAITLNLEMWSAQSVSAHWANQSLADTVRTSNTAAPVILSQTTMSLAAGDSVGLTTTFTLPNLPDIEHWVYSGFVRITPQNASGANATQGITLPYLGFKGDYRTVPILRPNTDAFPMLRASNGTDAPLVGNILSYDMVNNVPVVTIVKDHPTQQITIQVLNSANKVYTAVVSGWLTNVPQNFKSYLPNTDFSWTGYTKSGSILTKMANGTYRLKVLALRPFGDKNNATQYDTWTSPEFKVQR
ncbi:peptidase S8/S53 domain-containing protein [Dimargaris cristalligena]|uniref:Peptidase S8/S53 domain-containing protein n=1 Tax=Dimargaris cristalligena TaxID=215637 RepID=A0A4P9ZT42_9FUNG|nr:peptidase S8/S53 domain-containing protein [Dimargaris cristalligena]|eukprot:RKP36637.1 peptidase S8/S53 domain-containing protein [Dimargaris cristalligena]